MAFSVSPTSGAGPYTVSADFLNAVEIDGIRYQLEFRQQLLSGSCFTDVATSQNNQVVVDSLLSTGSYILQTPVSAGACRTLSLIIRDVLKNVIIDYQNVYVDNT